MRRIVSSSVACLVLPYSSTSFHKRHDFRWKKFTEYKICVLILSTNFVRKTSRFKKNSERYHKCTRAPSHKVPVILVRFLMKLELSGQSFFLKYWHIKFRDNPSSGRRVVPCGPRQLTVTFRNFSKSGTASGVKFICKGRGTAIPVQSWKGPEGFRRLRLPDLKTIGT